jgi:hypothetical protein
VVVVVVVVVPVVCAIEAWGRRLRAAGVGGFRSKP